ncbi:MAG: phosphohistidine phosphatase SixA [Methanomicrobiales archaeon]|nr:phosphohistidine phosphatase SixA [Methanomicrobiales archaeon]
MDLFILRHGKAEDAGHGITDAQRKLTKKGREEIEGLALWMAEHELEFDLIAASPLTRAIETAAIVADTLGCPEKVVEWKVLVPGGNPDTVCREVDRYADAAAVLLVGHEPLLSALVARIIAGDEGAGILMGKGALAWIRDFSIHQRPAGELQWLVTPKMVIPPRA